MKKIFLVTTIFLFGSTYGQLDTIQLGVDNLDIWHQKINAGLVQTDTNTNRIDSVVNVIPQNTSDLNNDDGFITSPNDADSDPNNENQTLSIDGSDLSISNGNTVIIPSSGGQTVDVQAALDNSSNPSAVNPYITKEKTDSIDSQINDTSQAFPVPADTILKDLREAGLREFSESDSTKLADIENNATADQTLSIDGNELTISGTGGNSVTLPSSGAGGGSSIQTLFGIPGTTPNMPVDTLTHGALDTTSAFVFVNGLLLSDSAGHYSQVDSSIIFANDLNIGDTMLAMLFSNVTALTLRDTTAQAPSGDFTVQYQAVYDAMTNKPNATDAANQDTLVRDWIADGTWSDSDVLYNFAIHTNSGGEALINWKNPGTNNATTVNAPTFTAYQGFTGNGTSSYVNTNFNPTNDGVNFTQNDAFAWIYSRTAADEAEAIMGAVNGSTGLYLIPEFGNQSYSYFNDLTNNTWFHNEDGSGFFSMSRSGAADYVINRNSGAGGTITSTSTGLVNLDIYVLCTNDNGSPSEYTDKQVAGCGFGASRNTSEESNTNASFEKYMDKNGQGVQ